MPGAARRAKKPPKFTAAQLARHRGEQATEKVRRKYGITVVQVDGPLRCLTPIPRSDLFEGQTEWTHPVMFNSVRYVLVDVVDGVHRYKEATK